MSSEMFELKPLDVEPLKPITVVIACRRRLIALGIQTMLEQCPATTPLGIAVTSEVIEVYMARQDVDVVLCAWQEYASQAQSMFEGIIRDHPQTKICVISDTPDPAVIREAMLQGATGFISEACNDDQIVEALLAVGNGRTAIESGTPRSYSDRMSEDLAPLDVLTDRERDVLTLIAVGLSTKQIANTLFLSPKTVETHRANMMRKLSFSSIAEVTHYASRVGLIGERES